MTKKLDETTYLIGFTTSVDNSPLVHINQAPHHLTSIEEGREGYDMEINLDKPGIPIFLQFKIPNKKTKPKLTKITNVLGEDASCIELFMPIRKNDDYSQHHKLIELEKIKAPCIVRYSSPEYSTYEDHNNAFMNRSVHQKSVYFSPVEIGRIESIPSCGIGYLTKSGGAVVYPSIKEINAYTFNEVIGYAGKTMNANRKTLSDALDDVINVATDIFQIPKKFILSKPRLPRSPKDGTLSFMVQTSNEIEIDMNHQLYYRYKINIMAAIARTHMNASLLILNSFDTDS